MPFQAKDVMHSASVTLQDFGNVHWTAPELHTYLNDALREIVALKPNAKSGTVTLELATGTLQTLPDEYTVLSRVTRNLVLGHDEVGGPTGGKAIRTLARREIIDSQIPGWQAAATLPFAAVVENVIHDMADPRSFYVVPGNDGTGKIEAMVGMVPPSVTAPVAPNNLAIENYTQSVDFPDIYRNAIVDFILYRAFSKDSGVPNAANRASAHFTQFREAIAAINNGEMGMALANYGRASA